MSVMVGDEVGRQRGRSGWVLYTDFRIDVIVTRIHNLSVGGDIQSPGRLCVCGGVTLYHHWHLQVFVVSGDIVSHVATLCSLRLKPCGTDQCLPGRLEIIRHTSEAFHGLPRAHLEAYPAGMRFVHEQLSPTG